MNVMTLIQAVTDAMDIKLKDDKNVLVFGEDVGVEGGVFRATTGLQKKYGRDLRVMSPWEPTSRTCCFVDLKVEN